MTDVTVTNHRADSSANQDLSQLARHGADAFGYKAKLRIDRKLAQLLRLRVSQINSSLKAVELANLAVPTLAEVIEQARQGVERVCRTPHLAYSFLRHAGLSVS
jgi:hypothetical protein